MKFSPGFFFSFRMQSRDTKISFARVHDWPQNDVKLDISYFGMQHTLHTGSLICN